MLHIPAGMANTYTYRIPEEHAAGRLLVPQPPAHADDAAHLLRPGRAARDRPHRRQHSAGHQERHPDPQHGAPVQLRLRPQGRAGAAQQRQLAAIRQHARAAARRRAGRRHLRPLLAPVNFAQSKKGTQYFTVWYAGPLSIHNIRGRFEFIPSNLQRFTADPAARRRRRRPIPRCPTTSATCSSRSTACSSRSSRASRGRPRSGCSRTSATSPT